MMLRSKEIQLGVQIIQLAVDLGYDTEKQGTTQFDLRCWLQKEHAINTRINYVSAEGRYKWDAYNANTHEELLFGEKEIGRDYYEVLDCCLYHALIYLKLGPIAQKRVYTEGQLAQAEDLANTFTHLQLKEYRYAGELSDTEAQLVDLALDVHRARIKRALSAQKGEADGKVQEKEATTEEVNG